MKYTKIAYDALRESVKASEYLCKTLKKCDKNMYTRIILSYCEKSVYVIITRKEVFYSSFKDCLCPLNTESSGNTYRLKGLCQFWHVVHAFSG